MTVHKLTAGDGYTYLTRQVASADEYRAAGQSLADYYLARGNPPGVWMGRGAAQLGVEGQQVSEAQMKALFGEGKHPDRDAMEAAGHSPADTKLGAAYPSYADLAPYPQRVADAVAAFADQNGRSPSPTERNQIAAKEARRGRRAVAGFDMVFTPVKSGSLLWALGGPEVRQLVEDAHHEAVSSAIGWIERHAAYTRTGHGGTAQIDATGLVCAAFDHRDSRSGDPDLHTHVAVANKVCGVDGKWRSLDARNLYALGVAASERYNTRFEDALVRRLGVAFEERPGGAAGKRPIREIAGIPHELIRHFSRRRVAIESRYAELRRGYRAAHGREPDRSTQLQLAQQATLETREGKAPGRTLAEQVTDWMSQARTVIGERRLSRLADTCCGRADTACEPDPDQLREHAAQVVRQVAEQRSTWTIWNVYAEAERHLRPLRFRSAEQREQVTQSVVHLATGPEMSVRIAEPELIAEAPELIRASDGRSVFQPHGSDRFTTSDVLLAEDRLVAAGQQLEGPHLDSVVLEAALAMFEARTKVQLDSGQRDIVALFATSPARIAVGIGPAGSGKTTAMRAFAEAWHTGGGRVVPLASSSKAAQVLGAELDQRAENLHKFLHENSKASDDPWFTLCPGDVVLVDEAGMAGTLHLARLLDLADKAGAAIRLLGDPAQLASVDAGGALRLMEREVGAAYLTDLHRFLDPAEGAATLGLRAGDARALQFYRERGRVETGSRDAMQEMAYDRWALDVDAGRISVLVASATDDVTALNARARAERVSSGAVEPVGIELHDGNLAGVGDWIVTRSNARSLRYSRARWVHNGDAWRVIRRHDDGALTVRHLDNGGKVRLEADYVANSVELAYAVTAHRVQGMTTDTAHALVTPEMTREALYVASTRGREKTTWYAATEDALDVICHDEPDAPQTIDALLGAVLARTAAESSATETLRATLTEAGSLRTLVERYDHARNMAALQALPLALQGLPAVERQRILADPSSGQLARVVGSAVGRGADPSRLVRAAFDLEDVSNVRSPALVLATRIEDYSRTLGVPDAPSEDAPLPWVAAPDVGHCGWLPYLRERAALIRGRADELGSLAAAYRDHYGITDDDPASLGPPPEPGSRRELAYRTAAASQVPPEESSSPRPPTPAAARRDPSMSQARGPRLSR
jgi:conjugative relaxase-like TrwC/TraI family protein